MKITQFSASNFQMLTAISVTPSAPVLMFAGKNEQGKSSLHDAIRMALTGESARVKLKKDFDQLVRDGAKDGYIHIELADGRIADVALPAGKIGYTGTMPQVAEETLEMHRMALPMVIDPHKFAALPENERRAFLFKLSGLKCDGKAVSARMLARGCDAAKVEEAAPMLRNGFSAAHDYAKEKAKSAKAMWKGVTTETYGEKKAETWKADSPVVDLLHKDAATINLRDINCSIEAAQKEIGTLEAKTAAAIQARRRQAELTETASLRQRIEAKLAVDRGYVTEFEAKVAASKGQPSATHAPLACPHCAGLVNMIHGVLVQHQEPENKIDPELAAELPKHEKALAQSKSAVANGERDLKAANDAAAALAEMEKTAVEQPAEGAIEAQTAAVTTLKARRKEIQAELDGITFKQAQAESAEKKTVQAAKHHADTKEWEMLADALAPDGIPGEMLADALTPFNSRLRDTSIATGWPQVQIDADMTIRVGGRIYSLASESATWRANAAVAEAISNGSGLRFACFDRVDCLDIGNREVFMKWMHGLAKSGAIETAVCFGTFKSLPGLPASTFDARWIERGEIQQPIKEAA